MTNRTAEEAPPGGAPRLLDQVRREIRARHYSRRTELAYVHWIVRYIRFHGCRHPAELSEAHLSAFLSALANDRHVAAATQNQALSALLFLYKCVLRLELPWLTGVTRARRPRRLPVVLTKEEAAALLAQLSGTAALMAKLMYGTGIRLNECLQLRVKDVDLARGQLIVRQGKGAKDRATMFPRTLVDDMAAHLVETQRIYRADRAAELPGVELPYALEVKKPQAAKSWGWHWVFPQDHISTDPRTGIRRRHHHHHDLHPRAQSRWARRGQPARPMSPFARRPA